MRRAILAAAAATAAAALVLAGASPALAAGRTISAGDAMYAIDCETLELVTGYSVNSTDAAVTKIGDGTPVFDHECAWQAAYDHSTGISYYIDEREGGEIDYSSLHRFDPATGESSDVDIVTEPAGEGDDPIIASMAIGLDGKAYAIDVDDNLYSLDLATAEVTFITGLADGQFFGFAAHPITGAFYVVNGSELFGIDVVTGTLTPLHELDFDQGTSVNSLQIDSAGVFWMLNGPMLAEQESELWSATTVDGSELDSGSLSDGEIVLSSSLLIIPGDALAATGSEVSVAPLYAALGVLLLGGALVVLRRRVA